MIAPFAANVIKLRSAIAVCGKFGAIQSAVALLCTVCKKTGQSFGIFIAHTVMCFFHILFVNGYRMLILKRNAEHCNAMNHTLNRVIDF